MMRPKASVRSGGFTLIEVLGALVIFSMGVLMVASMTTSLAGRFQLSSLRTTLAIEGQRRLDSIAALDYDLVSVGTWTDTLTINAESYTFSLTISQTDPIIRTVQVSLDPADGTGPLFDGTVYVARIW